VETQSVVKRRPKAIRDAIDYAKFYSHSHDAVTFDHVAGLIVNAKPVGTITGGEIADWLRSLKVSAITRNHYQRLIVLAFNFAVQRGYMTKNPVLARPSANIPQLTVHP
jgi:hypothetical protein